MRVIRCFLVASAAILGASVAQAQDYPNRPITMLGPSAGGGADFLMRLVADGMSKELGQPVVVENRSGSVGVADFIANGKPDGYTLLFFSGSAWLRPFLGGVDYKPEEVFAPVSLVLRSPGVLAVGKGLGVKTAKEFVELAKSKPGVLNFAGGGFGSSNHLSGELFKALAGIDMTYVPYKGSGPALTAAVSGEVSALFSSVTSVKSFVENGDLIALGVTVDKATDLAPGIPPLSDTVPGYDSAVDFVVFAPTGTPKSIMDKLHASIAKYLSTDAVKAELFKVGSDPVGSTPEEATAYMLNDMKTMSKVIKDADLDKKK